MKQLKFKNKSKEICNTQYFGECNLDILLAMTKKNSETFRV